jgi:hypothetical protein
MCERRRPPLSKPNFESTTTMSNVEEGHATQEHGMDSEESMAWIARKEHVKQDDNNDVQQRCVDAFQAPATEQPSSVSFQVAGRGICSKRCAAGRAEGPIWRQWSVLRQPLVLTTSPSQIPPAGSILRDPCVHQ